MLFKMNKSGEKLKKTMGLNNTITKAWNEEFCTKTNAKKCLTQEMLLGGSLTLSLSD